MGKLLIIKGADFSSVAVAKVVPIEDLVSIKVLANPIEGGTCTGTGSYKKGTSVNISAKANKGFNFDKWDDNNKNANRSIVVGDSDKTYTALFKEAASIDLLSNASVMQGKYWSSAGTQSDLANYESAEINISAYAGKVIHLRGGYYLSSQSRNMNGGWSFITVGSTSSSIEEGKVNTSVVNPVYGSDEMYFTVPEGAKTLYYSNQFKAGSGQTIIENPHIIVKDF